MDTRADIYRALFNGKKLVHGSFGLNKWIALNLDTNKLVDHEGLEYDTTFKVPQDWSVKPDRRTFSLYRHTFNDYDGDTKVIYSECSNFLDTEEGDDDSNVFIKTQTIGSFTLED